MGSATSFQGSAGCSHHDGPGAHRALRRIGPGLVTALLFDSDGVLADTERYGHLPAFNSTFDDFGVPAHWSEDEYAVKLLIGGGKERMASLFDEPGFAERAGIPDDKTGRK